MKRILKVISIILMSILGLLFTIPYAMSVNTTDLPANATPFKESKFIVIQHEKVHYRYFTHHDSAAKGNVLLIHGFAGSTFSWRKNIDTLVHAGYNVIAVDLPGFGYSSKEEYVNHSISAQAELLWKLCDTLGIKTCIISGHSMGAAVAGAMAADKPARTERLILVDGTFAGTRQGSGGGFLPWLLSSGPVERLAEVSATHIFLTYKQFHKLLSSAYSKDADSVAVVGYLEPFKLKRSASSVLEMASSKEVKSLSVDSMQCPVLIVWGTKDTWIPIENGIAFNKKEKNSQLKTIDGAGHCSMETNPAEFNTIMLGFLTAGK